MAFFKFRQRGQPPAPEPARRGRGKEPAAKPEESIDGLRRRARHRLVGAAVLVLLAVIGFPLLFDTQPRPVAVNAPITIPDKDKAPPLKIPEPVPANASLADDEEVVGAASAASRPAARGASAPAAGARPQADEAARAKADQAARVKADEAARAKADEAARAKADETARAKADAAAKARADEAAKARADEAAKAKADEAAKTKADEAKAKAEQAARAKREQEARAKREAEQRAQRDDAARARALLEGRSNGAASSDSARAGRFIVQVGAFADAAAVREARQKAERAGVRTYTQVVETSAGPRTRVRVGPFGSREEAEKAAAALKKAGLGGSILAL